MDNFPPEDERTEEEKRAYFRYWQSRTPEERIAETWRLSVEKYGTPKGSFRDGPFRLIRRMPDGSQKVIREWSGPNRLRSPRDTDLN